MKYKISTFLLLTIMGGLLSTEVFRIGEIKTMNQMKKDGWLTIKVEHLEL